MHCVVMPECIHPTTANFHFIALHNRNTFFALIAIHHRIFCAKLLITHIGTDPFFRVIVGLLFSIAIRHTPHLRHAPYAPSQSFTCCSSTPYKNYCLSCHVQPLEGHLPALHPILPQRPVLPQRPGRMKALSLLPLMVSDSDSKR